MGTPSAGGAGDNKRILLCGPIATSLLILLSSATVWTNGLEVFECQDFGSAEQCSDWIEFCADNGPYEIYMQQNCRMTCGLCTAKIEPDPSTAPTPAPPAYTRFPSAQPTATWFSEVKGGRAKSAKLASVDGKQGVSNAIPWIGVGIGLAAAGVVLATYSARLQRRGRAHNECGIPIDDSAIRRAHASLPGTEPCERVPLFKEVLELATQHSTADLPMLPTPTSRSNGYMVPGDLPAMLGHHQNPGNVRVKVEL